MNALDLMARLDGSILAHKIRATVNGEILILAKLDGNNWELTEKGQELANEHSNLAAQEAEAKTRKKAAPAVESTPVTSKKTAGIQVNLDI